jgi:hypothetical protein
MKTSQTLAQLALVGIAAGFLSQTVLADEKPMGKKAAATMSAPMVKDSTAAMMDSTMMTQGHECKGHNDCKGMGGCKMSEKDLKKAAKKMGMPLAKAGKAHDCKAKNECKGLGGCKTM